MGKCQLEQELHTKTNVELLRVRSLHQNAEMEHKNAMIHLSTAEEARSALAKERDELLKEATVLRANNDKLGRDVYTHNELLESLRSRQRAEMNKLRDEKQQLEEENEARVLEQHMLYEDLRSHCVQKHEDALELSAEIKRLAAQLLEQEEENKALGEQVAEQEKELGAAKRDYADLRRQNAVTDADLQATRERLAAADKALDVERQERAEEAQ